MLQLDPVAQCRWKVRAKFQADRDLVIREKQIGSSLDPSANPKTKETTKAGFDLTAPVGEERKAFEKEDFPKVDLKKFLD